MSHLFDYHSGFTTMN